MLIDVPQDDESVVKRPFAECGVDEVERAARAKRAIQDGMDAEPTLAMPQKHATA
ncbi:hypothetical protein NR798_12940 [Archangium gephyra]|uniref:hypothetical protein n=1 Tax=Archangium gephyra TaxID=48 RepID=UPI0035D4389F